MPDIIIDMHLHTVKGGSDSSLTPQELVREARRIGLSGVNISEHDRAWDARQLERVRHESGLFLSRGMEVSTDLGHIIVIGLDQYLPGIRRAAELRRVVSEIGGFMFVAHPFRHFFDPVHFRRDGREPPSLTPEEAARLPIFEMVDELEVANGGCTPQENYFALRVARILGKRGIGSSDAHSDQGLGCFTTVFERPLADERDLIAELKAGRYYPAGGLLRGALAPFGESSVSSDALFTPSS
ncbi:MAG: PHP-associated domain-containing protein [Dehalococcoidia bacterium]